MAISFAILATSIAFYFLYNSRGIKQENLVEIPVPKRNIVAYEKLNSENIGLKYVPVTEAVEGIVTNYEQLKGKYAGVPLKEGERISLAQLNEANELQNKHVVVLNTDFTRSADVKNGDIVDVYYVDKVTSTDGRLVYNQRIVSSGAIVISIFDKNGGSIDMDIPKKGVPTEVGVVGAVKLAVNPMDIPNLIGGTLPDDNHYVLAKTNQ